MANNYNHNDWELRSFSSGKLKKSSSVEILLGADPTRGRLLATSPISYNGRVTSHNMNGSGRPTSTGGTITLPPNVVPPSGAFSSPSVQKGSAAKAPVSDSKTVVPKTVQGMKEKETIVKPDITGSNTSLKTVPVPVPVPVSETSNPSSPLISFTPVPKECVTPLSTLPPQTPPRTPPMPTLKNVKDKGSHLPRLVTSHKPEYQSPVGTPRGTPRDTPRSTPKGTPKGTPVIGKRGHLFSVSTPEVEPESGQPLPPFLFDAGKGKKQPVKESVSDPFVLRRKIKPPPEPEEKEKEKEGGGGGDTEEEPVWQRRLSLLFVPPTEDELEETEKDLEETTRLLPSISTPYILRKQSVESVGTPPRCRRKEREERVNKKKEKEANKKVREAKESKRSEEEEKNQNRHSRINFEEEKNKKREEEKKKGKEEDRKVTAKFSRLRHSSISDVPSCSSSSISSSDEGENEEEEEGREQGDDYTSWDDTICSNRSAYFKKYYSQRGVIGKASDDKENEFKSAFETSHNSLSSLIRERMGRAKPTLNKETNQIGLIVLVVVLLVVIVVGISLTSYFYHLHLLELSIFNRIKFYEEDRLLEVYDPQWKPVIAMHMGTNLPTFSIPEDCTDYLHYLQEKNFTLPHHGLNDDEYGEMICLDWTALAQLHLRKLYAAGSVQCYSVWWVALKRDFTLRDCLVPNTSEDDGRNITWWGGGEMSSGGYPIFRGDVPPETMVTGKLDRDPWGQLLRRTWLSDRATLIMLPARFRGRVSVNHEQNEQVCLEMSLTACTNPDPNLSYTLCTAPNLTALTGYMHQRAVQERHMVGLTVPSLVNYTMQELPLDKSEGDTHVVKVLKETFTQEVVTQVENRLHNPVWIPWMTPDFPSLTQEAVLRYVDHVLTNTNTNTTNTNTNTTNNTTTTATTTTTTTTTGHLLLPASWQTRPGEMEFDPVRFPDPLALAQTLEDKGFHLTLTVHPYVSVDAPSFNKGMSEGLWVRQKSSVLPALARYDDFYPSVMTDFTNPRARRWYASQLKALKDNYTVIHFHLEPADAHALPTYHDYYTPVPSPDDTMVRFMAAVSSISPPVSTMGAVMPPLPPTFVTMGTGDGSWKGLETLVPRVLTLTMLGYPFIDVGPVGGLARAGHVPDRELYIRWIEAAAFLPAMQISVLPSTYGKEVVKLANDYQELRKELVLPRLMEKVQDALDDGTPLITPLSLFVPDDTEAGKVDDQWMLGSDLLVAPVTQRGMRTRTFYLPKGIWKDGIDGHLRNGGRWVKNYKVPLTKIPHFILRQVDDFER